MSTSNVRQLTDHGVPVYPITDKSLVIGLQDVPFESYVVAWNGASTPVPANIPAGVVVNYNGTNYTGTLAAGSATAPYLYLVASASQPGEYDRYIVTHTGATYAWTPLGSTTPVSPVIADDLVTNDPSKALSAKQGKILGDKTSELEAKVDGETVVTNVENDATTSNLRIASTGGTSTTSAETSSVTCFPVEAGKTYILTIPKVKNQYQIAYGFYTEAITSAGHIVTQPDPVVLGPVTDGVYQVVIPSGMNHLIVSHETTDGLPTVSYTTSVRGIVDDIQDLQNSVEGIEEQQAEIKEDLYGGTSWETVSQASVTNDVRIANTGQTANGTSSTPDCATASYQIPAGTSAHLIVPGLTSNQYTMVFGFANLPNTSVGNAVSLPTTPVAGPVSNGEYNIVIPDGYSYLLVCYTTTAGTPTVEIQTVSLGIKEDVQTLKEEIENINSGAVEISLPDKYVAVIGDVLQIFRRGVIKATNPYNYNVLFTCAKGANFPRYWRVYPTAVGDVGTYPITVTVTDNLGKIIAQAETELEIVDSPVSPATNKKIVCFGASTTFPGKWPAEAYRRLTGTGGTPSGKGLSNIAFCGPMTKDGAGYFGVGGWSWLNYISAGSPAFRFQVSGVSELYLGAKYTNNGHTYTILEVNVTSGTGNILCSTSSASNTPTASGTLTKTTGDGDANIAFSSASADASNPFWNYNTNSLDFQTFADTYCGGNIDCLIPLLGWNGRSKYETGFATTKQNVRTLLDAFHAEFPTAKVLLLGINCPSPIGGMGANYGSNQDYSDWYGMTVSALNLKKAYQEIANEDDYSGFVSFVDIAGQFDSDFNLPKEEQGVNIRNSEEKEWLGTNGVHPSDAGYGQIADAVYRAIVAKFCQ